MSFPAKVYRILIGSPSDVADERMLWLGIKGVTQEAVDARTLQGETREA